MRMPDSEAKKKWMKDNFWLIGIKIHRKHDADIIAYLEYKGDDKQKVIKEALREYMANHKEETE